MPLEEEEDSAHGKKRMIRKWRIRRKDGTGEQESEYVVNDAKKIIVNRTK